MKSTTTLILAASMIFLSSCTNGNLDLRGFKLSIPVPVGDTTIPLVITK